MLSFSEVLVDCLSIEADCEDELVSVDWLSLDWLLSEVEATLSDCADSTFSELLLSVFVAISD